MAAVKFTLNRAGVSKLLKSADMQRAVEDAAETMAEAVAGALPPDPDGHTWPGGGEFSVQVEVTVTDRASASIWVHDPRAEWYEAHEGLITRALANLGVGVRRR